MEIRELLATPTTPVPAMFRKRQDGHSSNPADLNEIALQAEWERFRINNAFQLIPPGAEGQPDARREYSILSLNLLASELTSQFCERGRRARETANKPCKDRS